MKKCVRISEREGGKLKQFYTHSGVRENSSSVIKNKYNMSPLDASENREAHCNRGRKEGAE